MARNFTSLKVFDMAIYIKASSDLSIVSYLWKPCESSSLNSHTAFPPKQSAAQIKRLKAVHEWADRTDPGHLIRDEYQRALWAAREPGETVVAVR